MKLSRAGVDVAKSVFQVHAVDRHDQPRWRAKLRRSEWLDALSEHLAPGRRLSRLLSPELFTPPRVVRLMRHLPLAG